MDNMSNMPHFREWSKSKNKELQWCEGCCSIVLILCVWTLLHRYTQKSGRVVEMGGRKVVVFGIENALREWYRDSATAKSSQSWELTTEDEWIFGLKGANRWAQVAELGFWADSKRHVLVQALFDGFRRFKTKGGSTCKSSGIVVMCFDH